MSKGRLVFTLVAPPLSVYLRVGAAGAFWLNLALTLAGYVPGVAHALWLLRKTPPGAHAKRASG